MVLVTVAAVYASTRFRASAEVSLCLLAAIALDAGIGWLAARRAGAGPGAAENELESRPEMGDTPDLMYRTADLLVVVT
jgi:hypothetical protein